jgi:hypothetical protein
MTAAVGAPTLTIPVDREHGALRLIIVVAFVGLWIIGFSISNALIVSEGLNIIAGIIGIVVSAAGVRLLEPFLKTKWPSGRAVQIDQTGVRLTVRDRVQDEVKANEPVSVLLWRFKVKRRGRVPKGWFVIACALEQNDNYLPVYTFASPAQTDSLNNKARFTELLAEKSLKDVKHDSLRVAGEQRRLRLAEAHRWNNGAEMTLEDFEQFFERLNGQFPQWIP